MSQKGRLGQTKGKARSVRSKIKKRKQRKKEEAKWKAEVKASEYLAPRKFGVCLKNGDKS